MMINKQQGGYSLIEILIGILILSIGILGMASMQINSKRLGFDALQRSIATSLAHDMMERMRANPTALGFYVGSSATASGSISVGGTATPLSQPITDCISSACSPEQLAAHDIWEWEQALIGVTEQKQDGTSIGGLVKPTGCITHVNSLVTVTVAWDSFQTLGNPAIDPVQCGVGTGLYGTDDEERQVVFFTTFINN